VALKAVVLRRPVEMVTSFALQITKVVEVRVWEHVAGHFVKFWITGVAVCAHGRRNELGRRIFSVAVSTSNAGIIMNFFEEDLALCRGS
jgi:hypothetical protein